MDWTSYPNVAPPSLFHPIGGAVGDKPTDDRFSSNLCLLPWLGRHLPVATCAQAPETFRESAAEVLGTDGMHRADSGSSLRSRHSHCAERRKAADPTDSASRGTRVR